MDVIVFVHFMEVTAQIISLDKLTTLISQQLL